MYSKRHEKGIKHLIRKTRNGDKKEGEKKGIMRRTGQREKKGRRKKTTRRGSQTRD